jgi:iron complex transport system ATP-binding protein
VLTESLAPAFLRVREVVALGRLPHQRPFSGVSGADHRAIESSLDLTGTKTIESRRLTTLSDGELSRVMLARAIAQQPRVLLLDEPTGRLDPPHQTAFFVSLASLLERKVVESVVIATHHLHFALHFADEIGLVTEGAVYRAPPADLIVSHQLERAFLSRPDLRSSLALDPERGWFVPVDRS